VAAAREESRCSFSLRFSCSSWQCGGYQERSDINARFSGAQGITPHLLAGTTVDSTNIAGAPAALGQSGAFFHDLTLTTPLASNYVASAAPSGSASGDLGGSYPGPNVVGLHFGSTHLMLSATAPSSGQYLYYNGTNIVGAAGAAPSGSASGDLGGSYPGPTVVGLHFGSTAMPLSGTAPSSGQYLQWNGTNIVGASGGGAPSGTASGDLGGSYPGPTVVGLHFGSTAMPLNSTAPSSGQYLQWDGSHISGVSIPIAVEPPAVFLSATLNSDTSIGTSSTQLLQVSTSALANSVNGKWAMEVSANVRFSNSGGTCDNCSIYVYDTASASYTAAETTVNSVGYGANGEASVRKTVPINQGAAPVVTLYGECAATGVKAMSIDSNFSAPATSLYVALSPQ
jgi:hypothetical protein